LPQVDGMTRESMELETQVSPVADTQIPAPEQAVTPEVATPETDTQADADQSQEREEDPHAKTIKRMERRIERLTAAKYQTLAEANQARSEMDQLRQRLAQYEQGEQPQQQQPDPLKLATEIATIREVNAKSNAIAKEGNKRFEGFDKAVSAVIEEAGPLFVPVAPGAPVGKPTALGEAVLDADDPAAVLNYLGNNPDIAADLHGLTATQVARRIARIEIELAKPKEPKQSTAPRPVTPVKAASKDDGGLSDNLSPEEWAKRFHKLRRGG
jgi:hypothetical protein